MADPAGRPPLRLVLATADLRAGLGGINDYSRTLGEALGEAGGWLRITAAAWNDHWIDLRFQDSGPGVPASLRERIFDPFFSTKPASSGTGLGLAVTQQVVRAHGGELAYEAHEGVGATFRVRLPRAS